MLNGLQHSCGFCSLVCMSRYVPVCTCPYASLEYVSQDITGSRFTLSPDYPFLSTQSPHILLGPLKLNFHTSHVPRLRLGTRMGEVHRRVDNPLMRNTTWT